MEITIQNHVSVTTTMCSHCADNERSAVTTLQPSLNSLVRALPLLIIGSMVNTMPFFRTNTFGLVDHNVKRLVAHGKPYQYP